MSELIKIDAAEFGLEETKAAQIAAQFRPMLDKMEALEAEFNRVVALPIDDPETAEQAKKLRNQYVKVRTGTAEIHKQQKAFYLAGGRYVDGWKNAQLFASQGKEERLEEIEKYRERMEAQRQQALREERAPMIQQYGADPWQFELGRMSEEQFQLILSGLKQQHEAKIEAERIAEEQRIAKEKQEAEERERIRLENERLRKEAEEREKQIKKEREEAEAKLREEREKAEAERKRVEAEESEKRRVIEEQARKERELAEAERKRLEDELKAKKAAEEKAEADRLAAIEAEASKGDADKVKDLIAELNAIANKYTFKSKKNQTMYSEVQTLIGKVISHIEKP